VAAAVGCRQALDDAIACEHATIDGKVPAHHKGTHSRVFLSQDVGFVCKIRLILAPVDKNKARVAAVATVTLIHWVGPPSTAAETLKVLHVEAAHGDDDGQWLREPKLNQCAENWAN
jgi:hypothetical protein